MNLKLHLCYITLRIITKTISHFVFSSQILQNAEINIDVNWKFWRKFSCTKIDYWWWKIPYLTVHCIEAEKSSIAHKKKYVVQYTVAWAYCSYVMFCLSLFFSGESSPRPVFRWLENGKPRDANRTEFSRGKMGGEKITSIVELRAGPKHNGNIYPCPFA